MRIIEKRKNSLKIAYVKINVYLILLLSVAQFGSVFGKQTQKGGKFVFQGKITGRSSGILILQYTNKNGDAIRDTTHLDQGNFTFKGFISEPTPAMLIGETKSNSLDDPNLVRIFLEPSIMLADVEEGNFPKIKIKGSGTQNEFVFLTRQIDLIKKGPERVRERNEVEFNFIKSHPNSFVSLFLLTMHLQMEYLSSDSASVLVEGLSSSLKESVRGKKVRDLLKMKKLAVVGNKAPQFSAKDVKGITFNLESLLGKYVLLNFWASWCKPCHEQLPYLKTLFNLYNPQGFEIISLFEANNNSILEKSIKINGLEKWHNKLSHDPDSPQKNSELRSMYSITAYPTVILIDDKGMIIYKKVGYSTGEKLEELEQRISNWIKNRPTKQHSIGQ